MTTENVRQELFNDVTNIEQQLAFDFIANTNTSLFVTGKAGTGKTTFVKRILKEINKNFTILAPTGIAAITVGGQTMHSFFGFPLEVLGPNSELEISFDKKLLIEKTDTFILDEVSMVRSDMVDCMDRCLRQIMNTHAPFGGKQVVFVGDLFQLPPVITRGADEDMLNDLYGNGIPFFYKAHVLKRINLPKIEFQKVYRQEDKDFLDLLDKMRVGEACTNDLRVLNSRVCSVANANDFSVTLTAYNSMADRINEQKLNELKTEEFVYNGKIEGDFKRKDALAPEVLKLKVGAQVIFCRNDNSGLRNYANGTIAKVVELSEDKIKVKLESGTILSVNKVTWENRERVYNKEERKIESQVIGTYSQYPLKLAWAITIHKSQGMTFDRMHLDLTCGIFAPGQAYVAVSRMRSLEGLTLSNPISPYHITLNPEIRAFANSFNDIEMISDELDMGKLVYKYQCDKDYNKGVSYYLSQVIDKVYRNDCRNAALIAKRMFDVMLDDSVLFGQTANVRLLKDCSMTCNFLNAVFCLYANRYEEAIGYANMVLDRRTCLEAMYIKGRALYAMDLFHEAYEMNLKMLNAIKVSEDKMGVDKKQLLFEAKVNEKIGNSNVVVCRRLAKLCPECIEAYLILRREILGKGEYLKVDTEEEQKNDLSLIEAFNNQSLDELSFKNLLNSNAEKKSNDFYTFKKKIQKISSDTLTKKIDC